MGMGGCTNRSTSGHRRQFPRLPARPIRAIARAAERGGGATSGWGTYTAVTPRSMMQRPSRNGGIARCARLCWSSCLLPPPYRVTSTMMGLCAAILRGSWLSSSMPCRGTAVLLHLLLHQRRFWVEEGVWRLEGLTLAVESFTLTVMSLSLSSQRQGGFCHCTFERMAMVPQLAPQPLITSAHTIPSYSPTRRPPNCSALRRYRRRL
mmetsp:Transcript_6381/g.18674  ORF Transcript_6381/g.18674 Transcript_6381/m.18674 type:complete len:207 (+) Transcript_6381:1083-1703(+)